MPHWKSLMDREYMFAFDLQGKDVTVTIDRITQGELTALGGRKSKKPLCFFREGREKKPLALNSTNCKVIAAMYGNDTADWAGKRITLYPTTTSMAGETVDCIRVRPQAPTAKSAPEPSDNDGGEIK
jgi:hypothetical protein